MKVVLKSKPAEISGSALMPKSAMEQVANEQRVMRAVDASGREGFLPLRASWHDSQNFYLVTVSLD